MADPLRHAATRLEAAVDRLAAAAVRPLRPMPQDEVAALGRRLDAALARLRVVLAPDEPVPVEPGSGEAGSAGSGRESSGAGVSGRREAHGRGGSARGDGGHGAEGSDPSAAEQER